MNDDDEHEPTPPRQTTPKPYRMTDSQRDARRGIVRGVPAFDTETTDRLEMLLTGQPDVHGHLAELRRRDVHELIWNLADSLAGYRAAVRKDKSSSDETRSQVIAAIDESERQLASVVRRLDLVEDEIGERHTKTEGSIHQNLGELLGTHRRAGRIATIALGLAIGAVGYVATVLRTSGADAVRLQRVEDDIRDIRRDMRHKEP